MKAAPCPKCGENGWLGPRYSGYLDELIYTCKTCGYGQGVKPKDRAPHLWRTD